MKPKKEIQVIFVITQLELGGAQKVCLSLYQGLKSENVDTFLITGSRGLLAQELGSDPQVYFLEDLIREVSLVGIYKEIKAFFSLVGLLRKIKKRAVRSVVHTHSTKAGLLGRWAAFFAGIPTRIHTIHGYGFHDHQGLVAWSCTYFLELITSLITTQYVCVSSHDSKTGIKLFPGFKKKHSLIRAAVDWKAFTPADYHPKASGELPFVFGTVSCFKPQKNLIDLLKAFAVVHHKNPQTRLEIIGDGEQRSSLEQWIKEHDLEDVISLAGWQSDVAQLSRNWHAFVLSSLWEGLPCAIVEARLLKLPVVCYDTGGIKDVIISGSNGIVVPQKDWQALSIGMLQLSTNQELFAKLQAYQDDLTDFKKSSMIEQHRALLAQLLDGKLSYALKQ